MSCKTAAAIIGAGANITAYLAGRALVAVITFSPFYISELEYFLL